LSTYCERFVALTFFHVPSMVSSLEPQQSLMIKFTWN